MTRDGNLTDAQNAMIEAYALAIFEYGSYAARSEALYGAVLERDPALKPYLDLFREERKPLDQRMLDFLQNEERLL